MQNLTIPNDKKFNRRSISLKNFDYTSEGWYFITICALKHQTIFGNIIDGKMLTNQYGEIVVNEWLQTEKLRSNVKLDDFIVMPNHFHGIIMLKSSQNTCNVAQINQINKFHNLNDTTCHENTARCWERARRAVPLRRQHQNNSQITFGKPIKYSLATIIGAFKSATTKRINELRYRPNHKLWQRNYYERIIRDEFELYFIREYIRDNPMKWNEHV